MRRIFFAAAAAMLLIGGLVGCSSSGSSHGGNASNGIGLSQVPAAATSIDITDWAAWKQRVGTPDLTSHSPQAERQKYLRGIEAVTSVEFAGSIVNYSVIMADELGWSSFDAAREIGFHTGTGAPTTVMQMDSGFDMATVTSSLTKHGYTKSAISQGSATATVLTHNGLPKSDTDAWQIGLGSVAVVPAQRLLVFAAAPDAVKQVVALIGGSGASLVGDSRLADLQGPYEQSLSADIAVGADACLTVQNLLGGRTVPPAVLAQVRSRIASAGHLSRYQARAAVVAADGSGLRTTFQLEYPSSSQPAADAAARTKLAGGTDIVQNAPYSTLFTLSSVKTHGRTLVMDLDFKGRPSAYGDMLQQRDLLFAACPG